MKIYLILIPKFGGLWEAGDRSFKYHLKRVMANAKRREDILAIINNMFEGFLNSRFLVSFASDADDLNTLTPVCFLIGRPINFMVEPEVINIHDTKLK